MAVVVGAPDVDDTVKVAVDKFIFMVGDIGGEVGRVAVGAHQDLVLLAAKFGGLIPDSAVLFIGHAAAGQLIDHCLDCAGLVQGAFREPDIVGDAVFFQVGAQLLNIFRQREVDQRLAALRLGEIQQAIAVLVGVLLGALFNILAVVAVLREENGVLTFINLQISCLEREAKLFDLVAGVIDVEFAGDVVTAGVQSGGQAVTDGAAAGVAHVHRAGRVGGDKFDHHLFALADIRAAIFLARLQHAGDDAGKPGVVDKEIDKAGACDLDAVDIAC